MKITFGVDAPKLLPWNQVKAGQVVLRHFNGSIRDPNGLGKLESLYMKVAGGSGVRLGGGGVCTLTYMDSAEFTYLIVDTELIVK
jgi:hypothetical protein